MEGDNGEMWRDSVMPSTCPIVSGLCVTIIPNRWPVCWNILEMIIIEYHSIPSCTGPHRTPTPPIPTTVRVATSASR